MNKKILGIGIMGLIVIGLIVTGLRSTHPATQVPAAGAPAGATVAATTELSKPAPKSPQKATAKPTSSVAAQQATPVDIMLDLSTDFARTNEDILQRYIKNPADFDTHYVVAKWHCGSDCIMGGVIDKRTGKVSVTPIEHPGGKQLAPDFVYYSLNSNLYRIINGERLETYSFANGQFTLIKTEQV